MLQKLGFLSPETRVPEKWSKIFFQGGLWMELFKETGRCGKEERRNIRPFLKPKNGVKLMLASVCCSIGVSELHVIEQGPTVTGKYYREPILPIYFEAWTPTIYFQTKEKLVHIMMELHPLDKGINEAFRGSSFDHVGKRG